ncbi:hypothetical protein DID88_006175 [Monilinia fructigena]|uniref:2-hydroxyacyl-CoA lyase n=1 Tax=Monilinia fructigena TaxID=38457 RepID=A0A395J1W8_9HELO|nr:hypothetical protein DID88_006175 [Monilinia fructigena]
MTSYNGAQMVAQSLKDLGVEVIFGLVGIPVVQIAEEAIALGIRFIAFRNEQAASYAATAYGYLTGRPGVCLVVGGPGVLHAMAGIEHHGMEGLELVSLMCRQMFIQGEGEYTSTQVVTSAPRPAGDPEIIQKVAQLIKSAKAPLIIVGKGAAYAQAESIIRQLINQTNIPFLPTPMGKGVIPDSHSSNTATSRSAALKGADMILVLGARLNWILHYGEAPKYNQNVNIIQVDTSAEEIGKNNGNAELGIVGDINVVTRQLTEALQGWKYDTSSAYMKTLRASASKNEATAAKSAKADKVPMTYGKVFDFMCLRARNTMDISRSAFPVEHPRLRLDAGTNATMGVGLGYAIAAHCAYNLPSREAQKSGPNSSPKKIVCLEGDSAFGFSLAEVETMARYGMDILIFVINNGGVYQGDSESSNAWLKLQKKSEAGSKGGLRSTSLGWEVGYEKVAEMCGGKGYLVHTPDELAIATEDGFKASVPVIVNVIIEAGAQKTLEFAWQQDSKRSSTKAKL